MRNQLCEEQDGQGRLLGWLEDDRVATCEGRSELPRRHGEWEVPGDNLGADADGLFQRVCELGGAGADRLPIDLIGPAGVVAKDGDDFAEVFVAGDSVGFAVVPGLKGGEVEAGGFDEIGELVHQIASLRWGKVAPGLIVQRFAGGSYGCVNV